jgi:hypothetical protein
MYPERKERSRRRRITVKDKHVLSFFVGECGGGVLFCLLACYQCFSEGPTSIMQLGVRENSASASLPKKEFRHRSGV